MVVCHTLSLMKPTHTAFNREKLMGPPIFWDIDTSSLRSWMELAPIQSLLGRIRKHNLPPGDGVGRELVLGGALETDDGLGIAVGHAVGVVAAVVLVAVRLTALACSLVRRAVRALQCINFLMVRRILKF